jgi:hypothetical protein
LQEEDMWKIMSLQKVTKRCLWPRLESLVGGKEGGDRLLNERSNAVDIVTEEPEIKP